MSGQPDSLEMPGYGNPQRGLLVTHAAGDTLLETVVDVRVGTCDAAGSLQVLAESETFGVLLVLELPQNAEPIGRHPVSSVGAESGRPAARVGAQTILGRQWVAYVADSGEVELSELGDQASGRFAVFLSSMMDRQTAMLSAVFQDVPVDTLGEAECRSSEEGSGS